MDKEEVISRLKEHLQSRMLKNKEITWHDKCYCVRYIMDFLMCNRKTAKKIFENEVLI